MKAIAVSALAGGHAGLPHAFGGMLENRLSPAQTVQLRLTGRQLEVLALLCEGLPNKLICRRLGISPGTVKSHISSILRELGVGSRLQAVVAARDLGVLGTLANVRAEGGLTPPRDLRLIA